MTVDEINSALCTFRCLPRGLLPSLQSSLITTWGNNLNPTPPLNCTMFDTGLIQAGAGVQTWAHGFSRTPPIVLPVTACVADDAALEYKAGDEIPLYMWRTQEEITAPWGISFVLANSTQLITQTCSFAVGNEGNLVCWKKSTNKARGNPSSIDNWRLRVRCFDCEGVTVRGPWLVNSPVSTKPHNLAGTPSVSLCVLRCKANDAASNIAIGDEVPGWMISREQFNALHHVNATDDGVGAWTAGPPPASWVKGTDSLGTILSNIGNFDNWVYNFRP